MQKGKSLTVRDLFLFSFVAWTASWDVTAATLFQATLAVPGRVIPNDPEIEAAVLRGEQRFHGIGCTTCHVPKSAVYES